MALDRIRRQSDQLDTALGELWLEFGESTELSGADGSVVFWMGKEDDPVVSNEVVEVDGPLCGVGIEVGGNAAQAQSVKLSARASGWSVVGNPRICSLGIGTHGVCGIVTLIGYAAGVECSRRSTAAQ